MKIFLAPKPLKFVIPIALIVFVLSVFFVTQSINAKLTGYSCQILELKNYVEGKEISENTVSLDDTQFKTSYESDFMQLLDSNKNKLNFIASSNSILSKLNPFYKSSFSFSTSQQDYICNKANNNKLLDLSQKEGYKVNYLLFIVNLGVFFIFGYLVSCFLSFVYHTFKGAQNT